MVLDARLTKLATGISAAQAVLALQRRPEQPDSDLPEEAREFEAIVEGMFLMAAVDGEISDEELEQLGWSIRAIAGDDGLELKPTLERLNAALGREGWRARLQSVADRLRRTEARESAFRLAAGVAFVDDDVAHAEAAAIESFASLLELDADRSQALLREVLDSLFA